MYLCGGYQTPVPKGRVYVDWFVKPMSRCVGSRYVGSEGQERGVALHTGSLDYNIERGAKGVIVIGRPGERCWHLVESKLFAGGVAVCFSRVRMA